ncbi:MULTISPECIES: arabinose ABC transporter substrate-binding protein [Halocynthiibacter]|uniref:Arabinose ABC transporter substrate-binding protein n=1 Tax=Halocynthiibacter halioticoli TaxID=2986804 RepID=A0AAE3IVP8_9RHOB|nr:MULTISPECIES: arabinose ABC transporter substrate-binding protein [Halocynthiibacter]MCV6822985.1 arabinose ABC transporter substrate-binding protein [Halocynthiibacter halioticoli]MCW4055986.1 arabinose ABC transporter substrate-binding protein [Halocynthiibacter sp. SDUM655004]
MLNRVKPVLLMSIAGTALLAGTAMADDKEIVAIYKSGTQQYFIDQGDGFKAAAEELGYTAKIINVELDANLAISAVSDAIASGAKGIGLTAPDQALGPAVARSADEAGVLLVATDDPIMKEDGSPVPFVGFDGVAMGTKVGERAGELLKESGWLDGARYGVLSVEVQTLSVCNDRTDAAKEQVIAAGASADSIVQVSYDGTADTSLAATGPVLTANPGVDKWVVFACNDEGVLGANNALKNAGFNPDDVIAVGLGAYEACRPWKEGIPSGFKAALYISGKDVGDAAARTLINSIETGEDLPLKTVANTTIVGPDNYADYMSCD